MPALNAEDADAIRLEDSSLEDVVAALLSGTPIWRGEDTAPFVLANPDSLQLFAFYAHHRNLWQRSRQVQAAEINNVLQALEGQTTAAAASVRQPASILKYWTLRRIEAHRFGGLHRHCAPDGSDPELFSLEIDKDITLIGGFNGAGKTALLSTVVWCLTGKALRSQHMPDEVHDPMPVYWVGADDEREEGEAVEGRDISVPPIVPVPSGADLEVLDEEPKCDTWVRLTFRAESSGETCSVIRRLVPRAGGRVAMQVEGLDDLGLSALAIEVGTLMPGVAGQMRFDEKTDFAQAIAQLTGLKPLEELGKRSRRVVTRLRGDERRNTERTRDEKRRQFDAQRATLRETWAGQPDLGAPRELLLPDEEVEGIDCAASIAAARTYLEELQSGLEASVEQILGRRLELAESQDVERVSRGLDDAADQLKGGALGGLPSMRTIQALGAVGEDDLAASEALIQDIVTRANALVERLQDAAQASRWQLYARVAAWHREHHPDVDLERCPVCSTDLEDVPADALVDLSVKDALEACREADADMAKTAAEWERDTAAAILGALPELMRGFADQGLPGELGELYRRVFIDELLAKPAFSGRLEPLKTNAAGIWEVACTENPLPEPPAAIEAGLPEMVGGGTLATRLANIAKAIQLARHRQAGTSAIERIVKRYIGTAVRAEAPPEEPTEEEWASPETAPLREQIETIRRCVQNAAPVVALIRQLDELDRTRQAWEAENRRLALLARAATAIEAFVVFPELVYEQVTGLIAALHSGTQTWLGRLYRPHYHGGPDYGGLDPTAEQGVGLRAGMDDMQVPAHQVMNASQLRACVWAFLFSLWQHVRTRAGGLDCILLDDPQMHFDPMNRENLAAAVPLMVDHAIHPIITSNDEQFLASLRAKMPGRMTESPSWTALRLNPISSSRLTVSVSPSVEEIRESRDQWKEDENDAQKAQDFVKLVRIHVENHLWNLLATDPLVMHDPTLGDLLNQLRGARTRGERPFEEPPFERFLTHPALRDNAPFYRVINKAHHRPQEITPVDAGDVDSVFREIDNLLRGCTASYARFMGRLTREDDELYLLDQPAAPAALQSGGSEITVLGTLAARSTTDILATPAGEANIEVSALGALVLYAVRSPCLGTLALRGQVVIVSLEREARDGDPVVALHGEKVFARMIARDRSDPSRVTLVADRSGTENVPPALTLPRAKTRLLPIVGVLYEQMSAAGADEACLVDSCPIWSRALTAARVVDDSAYPIIRENDLVLLERIEDVTSEALDRLEDRIVAVVASASSESFGFLKRMGATLQPGMRLLEKIGLMGSSVPVVVSGGDESQSGETYVLERLWRVHGVIRSDILPQ